MSLRICLLLLIVTIVGCRQQTTPPPAPRPVSVLTLEETDPGRLERITGAVASWKTDQLGFEVGGRVEFIIEPETDIAGQVYDKDGKVLTEGTLLAQLDPTRYELAVESAKAQVAVAEKQKEAAVIEHEQVIPAQTTAAVAQRDFAKIEVERNEALLAQNAAVGRQVDLSRSMLRQREADLVQLAATKEAKASEVASIEARIRELQEDLKTSERDLADCNLHSSFAGQVADIHVIPGSVVQHGQPVVTVQMMDPIKVELEVSAATARRLNHRDQVTIHVPQPSGENLQRSSFIYMIDPVADPLTRTFTVTFMMRNEKVRASLPDELKGQAIAVAGIIGKPFYNLPVAEGIFVNEKMLQKDEGGFFILKILNRRVGALSGSNDPILDVQKVRVTPRELRLSFLGLASLREITIPDDAELDLQVDLIAGDITLPEGQTAWDGGKLLYDRHRWLLRPGDLVGVDLRGGEVQAGIYVPLDAIMEQSGANFVFAVSESPDGDTARRVEVTVHDTVGTLRRVEAAGDKPLTPGTKIVAAGAAFLVDGEKINVAKQVELGR